MWTNGFVFILTVLYFDAHHCDGRPDLALLFPHSLGTSLLGATRCCKFLPYPALNQPLLQRAPFLLEKNPGIPNWGTGHSYHFQDAISSLAPVDRNVLRMCVLGHIYIHVNVHMYIHKHIYMCLCRYPIFFFEV